MKEFIPPSSEPDEFHLPDTHTQIVEEQSDLQESLSELEDMRQEVRNMETALGEMRAERISAEAELDELYRQLADKTSTWLPGPVQIGVVKDRAQTTRELERSQTELVTGARGVLADIERANEKLKGLIEKNVAQLREIDARFGRQAGVFKGKNPRAQA